ncbi:MAG: ABC transporter ATP-binding protein [Tyzzerella sp.]|nr:ABC transporter ATP-binding protein [Tyzzerella sp.]
MKINIQGIQKTFGKKEILKDVSFSAESGKCVGILGENGSGKSTLFSVLLGLQKGEGHFWCDGIDLMKDSKARSKMVGFVPQNPPLIHELSGTDNLKLWYSKKEMEKELAGGVLELLGIPEFSQTIVSKMSGGMRKRLSIGCAVARKPSILFLDEPSAALDLVCKEKIIEYLKGFKANGGIVVIATHDVSELEICDDLYILKGGKLHLYQEQREIHKLVGCLKDE